MMEAKPLKHKGYEERFNQAIEILQEKERELGQYAVGELPCKEVMIQLLKREDERRVSAVEWSKERFRKLCPIVGYMRLSVEDFERIIDEAFG